MLSLNGALTEQDIVQQICADYSYPVKNQYGGNDVYLSRDFGTIEAIATMVQIHSLVEQIAKSEQPAVKFETTIHGTKFHGITLIGEALYRVLLKQHRFSYPPKQQGSEGLKLWEEIVHRVHGPYRFLSRNPMQPVNDQGVTEGELLNAFAIRIREGARRKRYKQTRDQRRKDAQRLCTTTSKLVTRLLEHYPAMFGVRIELMYRQDHAEKIRLTDSAEHVQKLIEALKDDPWFGKSVGHFWVRKFLSEAGYRTSLFMLFDPSTAPIHSIEVAYVLHQWIECTMGAGLEYVLPYGFYNSEELYRHIECSKMTALILRLIPDANFPHFGVSEPPSRRLQSEFDQDLSRNLSDSAGFRCDPSKDQGAHLTGRFK